MNNVSTARPAALQVLTTRWAFKFHFSHDSIFPPFPFLVLIPKNLAFNFEFRKCEFLAWSQSDGQKDLGEKERARPRAQQQLHILAAWI